MIVSVLDISSECCAHVEYQLSAGNDVAMVDVPFVVRLAVEGDAADVAVGVAVVLGSDAEYDVLALGILSDIYFRIVENRRTEPVSARSRLYLIESQRRKNIPCRHLSHVLIARKTVRSIMI